MTGKRSYFIVAAFSAAVLTLIATWAGGVWDFPSPQPRGLLVFSTSEGLTVVPAR
jgi:hypothetical protein